MPELSAVVLCYSCCTVLEALLCSEPHLCYQGALMPVLRGEGGHPPLVLGTRENHSTSLGSVPLATGRGRWCSARVWALL